MENKYLRLREVMAVKGITGKALAEAVGVSIPAISAIVTGKSQPRFELLEKIADTLEMEIPDLFIRKNAAPMYIREGGQLREIGIFTSTLKKKK